MITTDAITWPELGWNEGNKKGWKRQGPNARNIAILERAVELVNSVPYDVTARWLFYGLWQRGYYSHQQKTEKKSAKERAYGNFCDLMSELRHSPPEWQERFPISLADDRRDPIHFTDGYRTPAEWLQHTRDNIQCDVDYMSGQERYVMVAFEAEAMQSQFIHYTAGYGVSLWPFSGHASIAYKQRLAEHIAVVRRRAGVPVIILYFGDLDPTGELIPETAFTHVRKWCEVGFTAYRAGLNREHVLAYDIPDDPDRPGKFQWEAVSDDAAREIITGALNSLIRLDVLNDVRRREAMTTAAARKALGGISI